MTAPEMAPVAVAFFQVSTSDTGTTAEPTTIPMKRYTHPRLRPISFSTMDSRPIRAPKMNTTYRETCALRIRGGQGLPDGKKNERVEQGQRGIKMDVRVHEGRVSKIAQSSETSFCNLIHEYRPTSCQKVPCKASIKLDSVIMFCRAFRDSPRPIGVTVQYSSLSSHHFGTSVRRRR